MISLNDYLYNGDTVIKILHNYTTDLRTEAKKNGNLIDSMHSNLLLQMTEILEHNDFLTSQAHRMREFYKYMTETYPDLAFTFKGRIKSLIRAEAKFNGQIVSYIYDYHRKNREYPSVAQIKERLSGMKDLIAYRIIIAMPKCHEKDEEVRPYYKDYIANAGPSGYQSLHVTFYDNISRSYIEVQLRTYEMDVNMFAAVNNSLINDGCGLFRGRLIMPYEHLSRFQNDLI